MSPRNRPIIACVVVPADDFVLGSAITAVAGGRVWLERIVPLDDGFVPYIRATGNVDGTVEAALRDEAAIESYAVVDSAADEVLIRVEWSNRVDGLLDALVETGATVLEGVGEDDRWRFRLRFDDRADLVACYRACADRDVRVDVERVHSPESRSDVGVRSALTETQRETLLMALEAGYFDVPRGTTLVELADEVGVSDTAVSQRLRRGTARLLTATLFETGGPTVGKR